MKEIIYTFNNRGCYLPDKSEAFEAENKIRLVIKPHEFELKVSDEVLRSTSCEGYVIEASRKGEVTFYDYSNNLLAKTEATQKEYSEFRLSWKQNSFCLSFGSLQTVDYYPNCDGESDRWGTEWVTECEVVFDTVNNRFVG